MKKIILIFTLTICLTFGIKNINAANIGVSINCPATVYEKENIVCNIYSNTSDGFLSGLKGNYEITNGAYKEFKAGKDWVAYVTTNAGFVVGNTSGGTTNVSLIGTLTITNNSEVGKDINIKINNLNASDIEYNDYDIASKSATVKVIKKVVKEEPKKETLYLDTLEVAGYSLSFKKDKFNYELNVDGNVKKIKINATSKNNTILGTGEFELKEEVNEFKIVVKNADNESTYKLIIKKDIKVTNVVENNEKMIEKALNKYDVVTVNINNKEDSVAYKSILEKIINKNKTLLYNIYQDNKLLYTYSFYGNKMDYILDNINLEIDFDSAKIDSLLKNNTENKMIINTKYKSYFPMATKLKIYNVKQDTEKSISLYKLNNENNLELIKNNIQINNNSVEFEIEKGALYILDNIEENNNNYENILYIQTILIILAVFNCGYLTYKYISLKKKKISP